ncbi:hypothetical protein VOLCADRAFT_100525 [Volvox carteri f. nagariensis]|uniref:Uncharacterized protein n=1 Tax=Volvox carteri f. nagariensis TaxID=3068 RepID=D8UKE2_VOLCA|nr:uncharacterized protein VOLCADRAFT_100525 [Volvox carteri f. nagariensis]EFJ39808.1 hypothetical protein VOLCADRAFT_100525 [Volvox carteri f. nagariensis]|eukprot:XP_002959127.1 hypothetical protein VOLCADRAFT_100525 [Volvox carteri f. nagariensis]
MGGDAPETGDLEAAAAEQEPPEQLPPDQQPRPPRVLPRACLDDPASVEVPYCMRLEADLPNRTMLVGVGVAERIFVCNTCHKALSARRVPEAALARLDPGDVPRVNHLGDPLPSPTFLEGQLLGRGRIIQQLLIMYLADRLPDVFPRAVKTHGIGVVNPDPNMLRAQLPARASDLAGAITVVCVDQVRNRAELLEHVQKAPGLQHNDEEELAVDEDALQEYECMGCAAGVRQFQDVVEAAVRDGNLADATVAPDVDPVGPVQPTLADPTLDAGQLADARAPDVDPAGPVQPTLADPTPMQPDLPDRLDSCSTLACPAGDVFYYSPVYVIECRATCRCNWAPDVDPAGPVQPTLADPTPTAGQYPGPGPFTAILRGPVDQPVEDAPVDPAAATLDELELILPQPSNVGDDGSEIDRFPGRVEDLLTGRARLVFAAGGRDSHVLDDRHPAILTLCFPQSFPYGFSGQRPRGMSFPAYCRHLLHRVPRTQFGGNLMLLARMYDICVRHESMAQVGITMNMRPHLGEPAARVPRDIIRAMGTILALPYRHSQRRQLLAQQSPLVKALVEGARLSTLRLDLTDAYYNGARSKMRAAALTIGWPPLFFTINPADMHAACAVVASGQVLDFDDDGRPQHIPSTVEKWRRVKDDPYSCAALLVATKEVLVEELFGFAPGAMQQTNPRCFCGLTFEVAVKPPSIDDTIELFTLAPHQAVPFMLMARYFDRRDEPNPGDPPQMLVEGKPGTGKSQFVQALLWYTFQHGCPHWAATCAYSWAAATAFSTPVHRSLSTHAMFALSAGSNRADSVRKGSAASLQVHRNVGDAADAGASHNNEVEACSLLEDGREPADDGRGPYRRLKYLPAAVIVRPISGHIPGTVLQGLGDYASRGGAFILSPRASCIAEVEMPAAGYGTITKQIRRLNVPLGDRQAVTDYFPPSIDDTIELFTLAPHQAVPFMLMARYFDRRDEPNPGDPPQMLVEGKPGTGKSQFVQALLWYTFQHGCPHWAATCAYSWAAATAFSTPVHRSLSTHAMFALSAGSNRADSVRKGSAASLQVHRNVGDAADAGASHNNEVEACSLLEDGREPADDGRGPYRRLKYLPAAVIVRPISGHIPGTVLQGLGDYASRGGAFILSPRASCIAEVEMPAAGYGTITKQIRRLNVPLGDRQAVTDYFVQGRSFKDECWLVDLAVPPNGIKRATLYVLLTRFKTLDHVRLLRPLYTTPHERKRIIKQFLSATNLEPDLAANLRLLKQAARETEQRYTADFQHARQLEARWTGPSFKATAITRPGSWTRLAAAAPGWRSPDPKRQRLEPTSSYNLRCRTLVTSSSIDPPDAKRQRLDTAASQSSTSTVGPPAVATDSRSVTFHVTFTAGPTETNEDRLFAGAQSRYGSFIAGVNTAGQGIVIMQIDDVILGRLESSHAFGHRVTFANVDAASLPPFITSRFAGVTVGQFKVSSATRISVEPSSAVPMLYSARLRFPVYDVGSDRARPEDKHASDGSALLLIPHGGMFRGGPFRKFKAWVACGNGDSPDAGRVELAIRESAPDDFVAQLQAAADSSTPLYVYGAKISPSNSKAYMNSVLRCILCLVDNEDPNNTRTRRTSATGSTFRPPQLRVTTTDVVPVHRPAAYTAVLAAADRATMQAPRLLPFAVHSTAALVCMAARLSLLRAPLTALLCLLVEAVVTALLPVVLMLPPRLGGGFQLEMKERRPDSRSWRLGGTQHLLLPRWLAVLVFGVLVVSIVANVMPGDYGPLVGDAARV